MLALIIMAAGISLIVGAKGTMERLLKIAGGAVLVLAALPCILQSFQNLTAANPATTSATPGVSPIARPSTPMNWWLFAVLSGLATIGLFGWHRRGDREVAREVWIRHNGQPRRRALPVPTVESGEAQS